jgi:exopolyphosphatase/guanosine-5'-triphosphate,3'-diphosphate pyrophosphatase
LDPQTPTETPKKPQPVGFAYWMERVLEECRNASHEFAADPVHDLRVSLRRCRSMADGLMAVDPDPAWKEMKKAGKRLFSSLGELRDVQVMKVWVRDLGPADDPETKALLDLLEKRETEQKFRAAEALQQFDAKQWRKWARELPPRAARVRKGSLIFRHLALERWTQAYELHRRALRNRSQVALHNLRIGIKRFRYIVENFLPHEHHAWGADLKELQDLLGDVHDLDVLWATAVQVNAFPSAESRALWRERIITERTKRLTRYRERMLGNSSLWRVWRAHLPQGEEIEKAALARMKLWASFLDPHFRHSQHVADLAGQLLEELARLSLAHPPAKAKYGPILEAAALMHDVGLAKGGRGHHKVSSRLIRRMPPPLGWTAEGLALSAAVARFHRGALPGPRHKALRGFTPEQRKLAVLLAGILRLANALDTTRDGRIHRLRLEARDGMLMLWAQGFQPMTRTAEEVAGARYVLETVLHRPIVVRTWKIHILRRPLRAVPA